MSRRRTLALVGLALGFTVLNAAKPLHVDDAHYWDYARHIASHPTDPYGFTTLWGQEPKPAISVLAPPGLPYWWALGMVLLGDQPVLWKLWLAPFAGLLVFSLHAIFRRLAAGLELPLVVLSVASPYLMPSFNLMLDVPSLAVSTSALALFFRGLERESKAFVVAAGVSMGVAMLIKYTAFVVPVVAFTWAVLHRRPRSGIAAVAVAVAIFSSWELLLWGSSGASHFLVQLDFLGEAPSGARFLRLSLGLLAILGGTTSALCLLSLGALGVGRCAQMGAAGLAVAGYTLLSAAPLRYAGLAPGEPRLSFWVLAVLGVGVIAAFIAAAFRLWRDLGPKARSQSAALFVLIWPLLELASYYAISPFSAVRRSLGFTLAATVLVGHLASRRGIRPAPFAGVALALGIPLAFAYWTIDFVDASAEANAVARAAERIRAVDPAGAEARIWFVGLWGFQFHALREGMLPLVPGRSRVQQGDWIVQPDGGVAQQKFYVDPEELAIASRFAIRDRLPLSTKRTYYGGMTPVERYSGPRLGVTLYRARVSFLPTRHKRKG